MHSHLRYQTDSTLQNTFRHHKKSSRDLTTESKEPHESSTESTRQNSQLFQMRRDKIRSGCTQRSTTTSAPSSSPFHGEEIAAAIPAHLQVRPHKFGFFLRLTSSLPSSLLALQKICMSFNQGVPTLLFTQLTLLTTSTPSSTLCPSSSKSEEYLPKTASLVTKILLHFPLFPFDSFLKFFPVSVIDYSILFHMIPARPQVFLLHSSAFSHHVLTFIHNSS